MRGQKLHTFVMIGDGELLAWRDGRLVNAVPEFDDCAKLAAAHNLPVKEVQALAVKAWGQKT